jgi:protein gp37
MGATSNIEWTDATRTPIRARRADGKLGVHCEKVSPACKNCYAERLNKRNLPAHGTGLDFTLLNREKVDIVVDGNMVLQPLRWKRGRRIFVCSQTDLFGIFAHQNQIALVFAAMGLAHWHTFQVLTKRSARMHELLSSEQFWEKVQSFMWAIIQDESDRLQGIKNEVKAKAPEANPKTPLPNVWLGVTAENQEWASKRIPALVATPAAKRFVSCEPLLGPIDLSHNLGKGIDWVIAGGESGPGARPMHPDWVRDLRNQCQHPDVPFFFKQWGEWLPVSFFDASPKIPENLIDLGDLYMGRVGKKAAGRTLDGREWNEAPE